MFTWRTLLAQHQAADFCPFCKHDPATKLISEITSLGGYVEQWHLLRGCGQGRELPFTSIPSCCSPSLPLVCVATSPEDAVCWRMWFAFGKCNTAAETPRTSTYVSQEITETRYRAHDKSVPPSINSYSGKMLTASLFRFTPSKSLSIQAAVDPNQAQRCGTISALTLMIQDSCMHKRAEVSVGHCTGQMSYTNWRGTEPFTPHSQQHLPKPTTSMSPKCRVRSKDRLMPRGDGEIVDSNWQRYCMTPHTAPFTSSHSGCHTLITHCHSTTAFFLSSVAQNGSSSPK